MLILPISFTITPRLLGRLVGISYVFTNHMISLWNHNFGKIKKSGIWLLILAGIKVNQCNKKGHWWYIKIWVACGIIVETEHTPFRDFSHIFIIPWKFHFDELRIYVPSPQFWSQRSHGKAWWRDAGFYLFTWWWWWHEMEMHYALLVLCEGSMMTSSNGNIFRVTGHLCWEFTGHRWNPRTKASDAELWCFSLICAWINGWVNNREAGALRHHRAHYDVTVMYPVDFQGKRSLIWASAFCLCVLAWKKCWTNSRVVGDLRRTDAITWVPNSQP